MNGYKVHHIGYAVHSINEAMPQFLMLGYQFGETVLDPLRNVRIVFGMNDKTNIELIEPVSKASPVWNLLNKMHTASPYHICYITDDIDQTCAHLEADGWLLVSEPAPAPAIDGNRVAFFSSMEIGLVEFVEINYSN